MYVAARIKPFYELKWITADECLILNIFSTKVQFIADCCGYGLPLWLKNISNEIQQKVYLSSETNDFPCFVFVFVILPTATVKVSTAKVRWWKVENIAIDIDVGKNKQTRTTFFPTMLLRPRRALL